MCSKQTGLWWSVAPGWLNFDLPSLLPLLLSAALNFLQRSSPQLCLPRSPQPPTFPDTCPVPSKMTDTDQPHSHLEESQDIVMEQDEPRAFPEVPRTLPEVPQVPQDSQTLNEFRKSADEVARLALLVQQEQENDQLLCTASSVSLIGDFVTAWRIHNRLFPGHGSPSSYFHGKSKLSLDTSKENLPAGRDIFRGGYHSKNLDQTYVCTRRFY
ncbi:hypothetical protein QC762_512050 [Podospora pseudocomata]|uniref:Uncharacterized protein n=1 Tax=Podospora pseudocomata TaxID=2093779 RepID=A0ABR0GBZ5_9PEZI|nr:hypothetical protein QC762_512050 [Podospora pseudocomata]